MIMSVNCLTASILKSFFFWNFVTPLYVVVSYYIVQHHIYNYQQLEKIL